MRARRLDTRNTRTLKNRRFLAHKNSFGISRESDGFSARASAEQSPRLVGDGSVSLSSEEDGLRCFSLHEVFLFVLLVGFIVLALQAVYGQPQPCEVDGWVMYDTGQPCNDSAGCYCNITNASGSFVGSAVPNNTGYYIDTVSIYNESDDLTSNCTDDTFRGWNQKNCTGSKANINVTVLVPEFPGVGGFPGFVLPLLISGGLCLAFIRVEDKP